LPRGDALSEDIRELVLHHKHDVSHVHFGQNIAALVEAIKFARKSVRSQTTPKIQRRSLGLILAAGMAAGAVGYVGAHFAGISVPWSGPSSVRFGSDTARAKVDDEAKVRVASDQREKEAEAAKRKAEEAKHAEVKRKEAERERVAALKAEEDRQRERSAAEVRRKAKEEAQAALLRNQEEERRRSEAERARKRIEIATKCRSTKERDKCSVGCAWIYNIRDSNTGRMLDEKGFCREEPRLRAEEEEGLERELHQTNAGSLLAIPCEGVRAPVANNERCLKPGDDFNDCDTCPEMVVVPAGEFMMGEDEYLAHFIREAGHVSGRHAVSSGLTAAA
jgi:flagellar biosynthesis GTPase FlhF